MKKTIAAVLAVMMLCGCSAGGNEANGDLTSTTESTAVEETTADTEKETTRETTVKEETTEEAEESVQTEKTTRKKQKPEKTGFKTIGNDVYGYLIIPSTWLNFVEEDSDGNDALYQVCSQDMKYIISLSCINTPENTAVDVASALAAQMDSEGVTDLETASVKLGGIDAYQIYGSYEDGTMLIIWTYDGSDGYIHYISAEGPADGISIVVGYIEGSYRTTQEE